MHPIGLLVLVAAASSAAEVSLLPDRQVAEVTFLKRVAPGKFIQDSHGPEVTAAVKKGAAFAAVLEPGEYDIRLRLPEGQVVEGVSLSIEKPPATQPLSEQDLQRIKDYIAHMRTFYDNINVFFTEGWRGRDETSLEGRACVLVECLRHRPYHLTVKKGAEQTVVWRLEKWYFERLGGGWRKCKDFEVLYRLSPPVETFKRYKWYFCRELAGIKVTEGNLDLGTFKVPEYSALPGRVGLAEDVPEGTQIAPQVPQGTGR